MMNANVYAFANAKVTLNGMKLILSPRSNVSAERIRMQHCQPSSQIPIQPRYNQHGITIRAAMILGTRYALYDDLEDDLALHIPSSLAILLPTTPASRYM
jgi:hypothetical protein